MKASLILTTYNRKDALELCLLSIFRQQTLPAEILVADDGSRPDTGELVTRYQQQSPVPLIHVWQEDDGFQAARIRNKAIARSTGDYTIIIDGDLVLNQHFVADHLRRAQPNLFLQGHRVLLTEAKTTQVLQTQQVEFSWFESGVENPKNALRNSLLAYLNSGVHTRMNGIKSCNMSFWKSDLLKVNGFNEAFVGWGREDSELALRLYHAGLKRSDLRFCALSYHLYHREYSRSELERNDVILERTKAEKLVRCERGLDQYV